MEIPPINRFLLVILGVIACSSCSAASAELNFFQITDPHIFEPQKDDVEGNKEAFRWCINQINERLGAKADYKFIVFTGDLGLEGLPGTGGEKEQKDLVEAAKQLAAIIKDSKVKQWLFLLGNNEQIAEDPKTIGIFHRFIKALQTETGGMKIVDFCPVENDPSSGVLDVDTSRFIGFNNASFKSDDSAANANAFHQSQLKNVEEVLERLARPGFKDAYIFYHIPEIDDPFYSSLDPAKPDQRNKLSEREAKRGELGKNFPYSSWTVAPDVRAKWNEVVTNPSVKGLFAGHFHSSERKIYRGFGWILDPNYLSGSLLKLYICPPLASKNQKTKPQQARGFREVSIDCESGNIKSTIFWYEKNRGAQPQLVERQLALFVDPTTNTASGLIHLSNPTDKEISLSLSADDFKSRTTGYGLNTKVVFAGPLQTTGQQVYEAKVPPSTTATIRVDVSSFLEAGEATAHLFNYGESIGTLRATKWRLPFAVRVLSPTPDKPDLMFTSGKRGQIILKNDDPMTYPITLSIEVGGVWSDRSCLTLSPNGSAPVEINPRTEWFPGSAWMKEGVRDGNIRLKLQLPDGTERVGLAERIIPFKAHLDSVSEFWQTLWGYLFVLLFLVLGGVCSVILSNWVPNRISRADLQEQFGELARRTRDLSARIDSGLRVLLRVERNRLSQLLKSRSVISADFVDLVKRCRDKIAVLSKQIDLATQLDRARLNLERVEQLNPIPTKIDLADRELQGAADLLCRSDPTVEDLDTAGKLILAANQRIDRMEQDDSDFVSDLLKRIASLKADLYPNPEPAPLQELKAALKRVFTTFEQFSSSTSFPASQYWVVDFVTTQLGLIREYQPYYDSAKTPHFPKQDTFVKYLQIDTMLGLRKAKLLLQQVKEGIFVEDVVRAIESKSAEIVIEPCPILEDRLSKFTVQFRSDELNMAAAREEIRCKWDFGHNDLTENGWEAYHYFPSNGRTKYDVQAMFSKQSTNANSDPVGVSKQVNVEKTPDDTGDRNLAEGVRLGIVLMIALIGLLAGAREQLAKLDLIPAAIAVFLLGFGADTIKNLISPKQAQK